MYIKILILALAILSLLVLPQRGIAEPIHIVPEAPHIKVYTFEKVLHRWGDKQWTYLSDLVDRESKWDATAQNPNSTAYGIGQFLNSTWKSVGCEKTSDPYKQVDCMLDYIEARYGTPQGAIKFWNANHWY